MSTKVLQDALIDLRLGPPGKAKIIVDGVDISRLVHRIELMMEAQKIAQLVLHCHAKHAQLSGLGDAVLIGQDENTQPPPLRPAGPAYYDTLRCEVCGEKATDVVVDQLDITAVGSQAGEYRPLYPPHHFCPAHTRESSVYALNAST